MGAAVVFPAPLGPPITTTLGFDVFMAREVGVKGTSASTVNHERASRYHG
jgi:hypothetical protein